MCSDRISVLSVLERQKLRYRDTLVQMSDITGIHTRSDELTMSVCVCVAVCPDQELLGGGSREATRLQED